MRDCECPCVCVGSECECEGYALYSKRERYARELQDTHTHTHTHTHAERHREREREKSERRGERERANPLPLQIEEATEDTGRMHDRDYIDTLLLTFRAFTTADDLLAAMMQRYATNQSLSDLLLSLPSSLFVILDATLLVSLLLSSSSASLSRLHSCPFVPESRSNPHFLVLSLGLILE